MTEEIQPASLEEWRHRAEGLQAEVERWKKAFELEVAANRIAAKSVERRAEAAEAEVERLKDDFWRATDRASVAEKILAEVCDAAGEYHAAATKKGAEAFPIRLTDAVVGARRYLAKQRGG